MFLYILSWTQVLLRERNIVIVNLSGVSFLKDALFKVFYTDLLLYSSKQVFNCFCSDFEDYNNKYINNNVQKGIMLLQLYLCNTYCIYKILMCISIYEGIKYPLTL